MYSITIMYSSFNYLKAFYTCTYIYTIFYFMIFVLYNIMYCLFVMTHMSTRLSFINPLTAGAAYIRVFIFY